MKQTQHQCYLGAHGMNDIHSIYLRVRGESGHAAAGYATPPASPPSPPSPPSLLPFLPSLPTHPCWFRIKRECSMAVSLSLSLCVGPPCSFFLLLLLLLLRGGVCRGEGGREGGRGEMRERMRGEEAHFPIILSSYTPASHTRAAFGLVHCDYQEAGLEARLII